MTIDQSFSETRRARLQALANDVAEIVAAKFSKAQLHSLPIRVYRDGTPPSPMTTLDDWQMPTLIRIRLNVNDSLPDGLPYAQFAYQLGHELGHVMLGLYRSNGLLEACAVAVSYDVLDELANRWAAHASPLNREYSPNFRLYREQAERIALARFPPEVRAAVSRKTWGDVSLYLRMRSFDVDQLSQELVNHVEGRALQALAAIVLRAKGTRWSKLHRLGDCPGSRPERKSFSYRPIESECMAPIADTFAHVGAGPFQTDLLLATFDQVPPNGPGFVFWWNAVNKWARLSEINRSNGGEIRKRLGASRATSIYITTR